MIQYGNRNPTRSRMRLKLPSVFLKQGELYISNNGPALIWTVLGSCVTTTMYCPELGVGGMTHSLLPYPLPGKRIPYGHEGRFVDTSIRLLLKKMLSLGVEKENLEVKVFGGGNLLSNISGKPLDIRIDMGRQNADTAFRVVQELGLQITAKDVGGNRGRRLMFYPHRGDVWVKKINRNVTPLRNSGAVTGLPVKITEKQAIAV